MTEELKSLLKDEDTIFSAALAFVLEFIEPIPLKRRATVEMKPVEYFSRNDSDSLSDTYQPQCDQIPTDMNDMILLDNVNIPVERVESCREEEMNIEPAETRLEPEVVETSSPKKAKSAAVRTRVIPKPVRFSSRVLLKRLVREEEEKKRSRPVRKVNQRQQHPAQKKKDKGESPNERRLRERAAKAEAAEDRKQRKIIEKATKSTCRAFGLVASEKRTSGMNNIQAWRNWHLITVRILRKIHDFPRDSTFRCSHFNTFISNSVTAMEKTMLAARPRPDETHELMLRFIIDFNYIWEIAYKFGVKQVMGDMGRLIEKVVGKYLSSDKLMRSTHLPWIQTKEIFELLLSQIVRIDTVYDLLMLLNKMLLIFLRKWSHRTNEFEAFKAYAISQLTGFCGILSKRLTQLTIENKYKI